MDFLEIFICTLDRSPKYTLLQNMYERMFVESVKTDVINHFLNSILAEIVSVFTYEERFPDILSIICAVDTKKGRRKLAFLRIYPNANNYGFLFAIF